MTAVQGFKGTDSMQTVDPKTGNRTISCPDTKVRYVCLVLFKLEVKYTQFSRIEKCCVYKSLMNFIFRETSICFCQKIQNKIADSNIFARLSPWPYWSSSFFFLWKTHFTTIQKNFRINIYAVFIPSNFYRVTVKLHWEVCDFKKGFILDI